MRPGRFFWIVFGVHLVVSVAYYFLILGSDSGGPGAGNVGMGVFGGLLALFRLTGRHEVPEYALPLIFLLNSVVTAGIATGILQVVRRLRAA